MRSDTHLSPRDINLSNRISSCGLQTFIWVNRKALVIFWFVFFYIFIYSQRFNSSGHSISSFTISLLFWLLWLRAILICTKFFRDKRSATIIFVFLFARISVSTVVSHTFHEFWSRSLRRAIQRTSQSRSGLRSICRIRFGVKFLDNWWRSGKISVAWTFKVSSQCSECRRSSPNADALRAKGHASGTLRLVLCSVPSWIDRCSSFRFLKMHENQHKFYHKCKYVQW